MGSQYAAGCDDGGSGETKDAPTLSVPASCSYAIMVTIVALVVLGWVPSVANAAALGGHGGGTDAGRGTGADALPVLPASNVSVPQVQLQRSAR
eukprot:gene21355-15345_t